MGGPIICAEVKKNLEKILQRTFCYIHDVANSIHQCFKIINS